MGLLEVLGQLVQVFADLLPRIAPRAKSTEWMVVDSFLIGPHIAYSRPVFIWPICDHVEYWPKVETPIDIEQQTITTADDITITVNPQIAFRITDPLLVREWWGEDYQQRIGMIVRGAVEEMHSGHNWSHIQSMTHGDVIGDALEYLFERGVEIPERGFCVEERARSRAIRLFVVPGG